MPHQFTPQEIADLEAVLSAPRFATYLRETDGDRHGAMELYCWNTNVSSAFYVLLQFCELAVRNAAVEAIEKEFGENWHLNRGFAYSLKNPTKRNAYNPRNDLTQCAKRLPTAGKVVAELRFAFWQHLFVTAHDPRLWDQHFTDVFPGHDTTLTIAQARAQIYQDLDVLRRLRNRIAHHEPIFARDLDDDQKRTRRLISWRRPRTAAWLDTFETVTSTLRSRP